MVKAESRPSGPSRAVPAEEGERLSTTVRLGEIYDAGLRLEASAFNIEARNAVQELRASGLPLVPLYGTGGLSEEAHNAFRFSRVYVDADHGVPFLSSSDIISMRPESDRFLSRKLTKRLDELLVREWDVLISCSGTIGNVTLASRSLAGNALSQHAIRLRTPDADTAGYVTAFLRCRYGRLQLTQFTYGSVVQHIEPEHLTRILVPDLHPLHRVAVGQRMVEAAKLRDQANKLLDRADALLHERLELPPLRGSSPEVEPIPISKIRLSQLQGRLEASFHDPLALEAEARVHAPPVEVVTVGDPRVTREVRAITKFRKRVYVAQGGIPLLSSKQLFQVDPVDVKGLAKGAHTKDLAEIELKTSMIVVTRSGTIGRVQIIPAYMEGWAGSEHATRFLAAEGMSPGYLYAWLASDYGYCLISRNAYGSVILEVDRDMFCSIPIPLPERTIRDEIGAPVLEANTLRDRAWRLERDAISELEQRVQGGLGLEDLRKHSPDAAESLGGS